MLGNPYRVARKCHPAKRITEMWCKMRKENRGEYNKGFSLVELIVVIALIAVLVGTLAPAYLKYVEKSRKQRDEAAAGELQHAAELVVLSGEYRCDDEVLVTFDSTGVKIAETDAKSALTTHMQESFGNLSNIKPCSKTYTGMKYTISIHTKATATSSEEKEIVGSWGSQ